MAKETLPLRRFAFSAKSHPTITRILIAFRSTLSLENASTQKARLFTRTLALECLQSIGILLSPVHFQGPEPQWVSCYAFFKW